MPLEFGPAIPADRLVRDMRPGRLPAGAFTDDTEMALALAESLLARRPLDPADLAARFVAWHCAGPADVGIQTSNVLSRIARGASWQEAVDAIPAHWRAAVHGEWPVRSGDRWEAARLIALADRLAG
ncbi:MAG: ADP-ribosylglycohydrolase family protein [Anaerolineae bacterium]|nr:ADP-ribosylglycohydrolase family protein [Anaerolineae bacterium]